MDDSRELVEGLSDAARSRDVDVWSNLRRPAHRPEKDVCLADEQRRNDRKIFFPVTVVGVAVVMTLFIYVAALFGDAKDPINLDPQTSIRQSILAHGVPVILAEAGLLVFVSIRAMAQDRWATMERLKSAQRQAQ